ncbi:MAG: hypothetical protein ACSHYA_16345 [Opitutaceae bacterium]
MKVTSLISTVTIFIGILGVIFAFYDSSEKPGSVYVYGHWIDLTWEVCIPIILIGGCGLIISILNANKEAD